jgi:hypothetical protein
VNKKALNQTECLFAFQMTGPQERKAIESWISEKGVNENIVEVLPHLRVGEPHVWSPQWLQISKTIRISAKTTADVSSTPKIGQRQAEPRELSAVDLDELRQKMAATVEAAAASDPGALKKRVADLQRENAELQRNAAKMERPTLADAEREALASYAKSANSAALQLGAAIGNLEKISANFRELGQSIERALRNANMQKPPQGITASSGDKKHRHEAPNVANASPNVSSATGGMRRMMIALAQRPGLSARQLGVRAGLSSSSGTFGTYLGKLRSNAWLDGDRNRMELTRAGITALGPYDPLPTGRDLLAFWLGELGNSGAARILKTLADHYPNALSKADLGERAGISHTSGTFGTYLGKLRTLELIHGSRELTASAELFE